MRVSAAEVSWIPFRMSTERRSTRLDAKTIPIRSN
jgi:hypothetical protein